MANLMSVIENPWAWFSRLMEERRLRPRFHCLCSLNCLTRFILSLTLLLKLRKLAFTREIQHLVASFQPAYCSPELANLLELNFALLSTKGRIERIWEFGSATSILAVGTTMGPFNFFTPQSTYFPWVEQDYIYVSWFRGFTVKPRKINFLSLVSDVDWRELHFIYSDSGVGI